MNHVTIKRINIEAVIFFNHNAVHMMNNSIALNIMKLLTLNKGFALKTQEIIMNEKYLDNQLIYI